MNDKPLTFGERAVGLTFNPSKDLDVDMIKRQCADLIDLIEGLRKAADSAEKKRMFSLAITEIQSAQMWAVKSQTWRGDTE
jgi:hypothetical protein